MEGMMVFLMLLLGAAPVLLVTLLGTVAALLLWRRTPRPALLVLIACAGQFVSALFGVWISGSWLPSARAAGNVPLTHLAQLMGIWGACNSLLHAVWIGLLVWAAFAGRSRAPVLPPPLV